MTGPVKLNPKIGSDDLLSYLTERANLLTLHQHRCQYKACGPHTLKETPVYTDRFEPRSLPPGPEAKEGQDAGKRSGGCVTEYVRRTERVLDRTQDKDESVVSQRTYHSWSTVHGTDTLLVSWTTPF